MNGAHLRTVQQLLGHKDIKMTMRYFHLSKDFVQDAVENLGRKYNEIGINLAQKGFDKRRIEPNLLSFECARSSVG